jgi:ribosomal-protein-alanine N-acetyltransferase
MNPPAEDIDRIMAVMAAAFDPAYGEAWTRRQIEDALLLGNCHYELLMANEDCAGFYLARNGYGEVELLLLAVAPKHRRQGYGLRLLQQFQSAAHDLGAERLLLEMRDSNPAEALYRQFGFAQVGLRKDYYKLAGGLRSDAVTFAKMLD